MLVGIKTSVAERHRVFVRSHSEVYQRIVGKKVLCLPSKQSKRIKDERTYDKLASPMLLVVTSLF